MKLDPHPKKRSRNMPIFWLEIRLTSMDTPLHPPKAQETIWDDLAQDVDESTRESLLESARLWQAKWNAKLSQISDDLGLDRS